MSVKFVYKCPACSLHHSAMDDALDCCELEAVTYFKCHNCGDAYSSVEYARKCCECHLSHAWHCTYCGIVDYNEKEHKCPKNVVHQGDES